MGIMVFLIFPMPKLRMEPFLLKIKAGCAILTNEKSKTNKIIVADKALFRIKVFIISIYNSYINIIIFTIYTILIRNIKYNVYTTRRFPRQNQSKYSKLFVSPSSSGIKISLSFSNSFSIRCSSIYSSRVYNPLYILLTSSMLSNLVSSAIIFSI